MARFEHVHFYCADPELTLGFFDATNEIDGVTYATNEDFYNALCAAIFGA